MKKIYNAPYLKVVEVKNDIIATSGELRANENASFSDFGNVGAQGRQDFFEDDEF